MQKLQINTSAEWMEHFLVSERTERRFGWADGAQITPQELDEIVDSLRAWQLGETSDGAHLMAAARLYAAKVRDPRFIDAVRLFIREEQRHGENLGRFLDLAGVPRAKKDWGDSLFRAARYALRSMEAWVTPVVMVETHALIYYNAIRLATKSPLLRDICAQILVDEIPHIRFQCQRIAILHRRRAPWLRDLILALHRPAFAAVTLTIWAAHGRALRAGGYSFSSYWRAAFQKMNQAWKMMSPVIYDWEAGFGRVRTDHDKSKEGKSDFSSSDANGTCPQRVPVESILSARQQHD